MTLAIQEIHTYYGQVHMLKGVSMEVNPGEIVAILGRNGAGKTTTIKSVMGLAPPKEGKILFNDEDIARLPPHLAARKGLAYVPASRGIFTTLSAFENLKIFQKKGARWDAQGVIDLFPRLDSMKDRNGDTLSGGEQQMLAMGRGLMSQPKLMMFDEPSLGLAPILVQDIFDLVKKINQEGVTILLVEQNVTQTLAMCDRAYVLENGRNVLEGTGQELMANDHVREVYLGI